MGHIHNHTIISGAKGTPEEAYAYARDIAGMDFLCITDHAEEVSSREWTDLTAAADLYNDDNSFVTFRGFEWSSSSIYGHVSITGTGRVKVKQKNSIHKSTRQINQFGCICRI